MDRVFMFDGLVNAVDLRSRALKAPFEDQRMADGCVYKRIARFDAPEIISAIRTVTGVPFVAELQGVRLNYKGEMPGNAVHTDVFFGSWGCLTYLSRPNDCRGGTAFYRHRITGDLGEVPGATHVEDWANPDAWEEIGVAEMRFGRCVLYPSNMWHARTPREAWGTNPVNGRLYVVTFFNVAEDF